MRHWLGGYVQRAELHAGIDDYLVAAGLGAQAGILGALALAIESLTRSDAAASQRPRP
jgi:hypothetical protein